MFLKFSMSWDIHENCIKFEMKIVLNLVEWAMKWLIKQNRIEIWVFNLTKMANIKITGDWLLASLGMELQRRRSLL